MSEWREVPKSINDFFHGHATVTDPEQTICPDCDHRDECYPDYESTDDNGEPKKFISKFGSYKKCKEIRRFIDRCAKNDNNNDNVKVLKHVDNANGSYSLLVEPISFPLFYFYVDLFINKVSNVLDARLGHYNLNDAELEDILIDNCWNDNEFRKDVINKCTKYLEEKDLYWPADEDDDSKQGNGSVYHNKDRFPQQEMRQLFKLYNSDNKFIKYLSDEIFTSKELCLTPSLKRATQLGIEATQSNLCNITTFSFEINKLIHNLAWYIKKENYKINVDEVSCELSDAISDFIEEIKEVNNFIYELKHVILKVVNNKIHVDEAVIEKHIKDTLKLFEYHTYDVNTGKYVEISRYETLKAVALYNNSNTQITKPQSDNLMGLSLSLRGMMQLAANSKDNFINEFNLRIDILASLLTKHIGSCGFQEINKDMICAIFNSKISDFINDNIKSDGIINSELIDFIQKIVNDKAPINAPTVEEYITKSLKYTKSIQRNANGQWEYI